AGERAQFHAGLGSEVAQRPIVVVGIVEDGSHIARGGLGVLRVILPVAGGDDGQRQRLRKVVVAAEDVHIELLIGVEGAQAGGIVADIVVAAGQRQPVGAKGAVGGLVVLKEANDLQIVAVVFPLHV